MLDVIVKGGDLLGEVQPTSHSPEVTAPSQPSGEQSKHMSIWPASGCVYEHPMPAARAQCEVHSLLSAANHAKRQPISQEGRPCDEIDLKSPPLLPSQQWPCCWHLLTQLARSVGGQSLGVTAPAGQSAPHAFNIIIISDMRFLTPARNGELPCSVQLS